MAATPMRRCSGSSGSAGSSSPPEASSCGSAGPGSGRATNVGLGVDHTLFAKSDGYVRFERKGDSKFISIALQPA